MTNEPHANAGSPRRDATRSVPGDGSAQAKEAFEKMSAATGEAADLIRSSYSKGIKGAQDYNNKVLEFAQTNTEAAFGFAQKLSDVKSPSGFHRIVDRTFTQAVRGADRADQGTRSTRPEGHARDRGAPQDWPNQNI